LVGNAGNAPDSTGLGAVAYDYRIGTTEVTNAQYAAFLNAKAKSDPMGLYLGDSDGSNGISRSGTSGSYIYAAKPIMADKPVYWVTWYSAIRFTNWLNNGQGDDDTESGAYTILGGTGEPTNGMEITRNSDATWFLPNGDEWYKAAYHQPASQGGDVDDYWLYPTRSNETPTAATANSVGEITNPGANVASYGARANWSTQFYDVLTVDGAGPLSRSFYGTADQGGNVFEWTESVVNGGRGWRGGSFNQGVVLLSSTAKNANHPAFGTGFAGFRVATIAVPEPSTYVLAAIGVLGLLAFRRHTRSCTPSPSAC
jgi:formylglycine-generating enzyme required for sulfatase activity